MFSFRIFVDGNNKLPDISQGLLHKKLQFPKQMLLESSLQMWKLQDLKKRATDPMNYTRTDYESQTDAWVSIPKFLYY